MHFLRMAGNHLKRCALMRWSFSILNDDTKCRVWWVYNRNTEAKKTRPKIMYFLRMAENHLKRRALMRWSFSILNDYTKYRVGWVNNRNTEAKKTIPKIMYFLRMAESEILRCLHAFPWNLDTRAFPQTVSAEPIWKAFRGRQAVKPCILAKTCHFGRFGSKLIV